jgi:hypothetical protein
MQQAVSLEIYRFGLKYLGDLITKVNVRIFKDH